MRNQYEIDYQQGYDNANEEWLDRMDKIRNEIEQIEINGHIRDVECFSAGINAALNILDKYREGNEG